MVRLCESFVVLRANYPARGQRVAAALHTTSSIYARLGQIQAARHATAVCSSSGVLPTRNPTPPNKMPRSAASSSCRGSRSGRSSAICSALPNHDPESIRRVLDATVPRSVVVNQWNRYNAAAVRTSSDPSAANAGDASRVSLRSMMALTVQLAPASTTTSLPS